MIRHPRITLAVLAGGRATRLGGALKPLLPLGGGVQDTPLARLIGMAQERFPRVLVVATDAAPYAGLPVTVVPDRVAGLGPLGGIEAALAASRTPFVLALAGDMPSVSAPLVDLMAARAREGRLLVPVRSGRPEPLHAIYPASCLPVIRAALAEGVRTVREVFPRMEVDFMTEDDWRGVEGAGRSFDNINAPDDLARERARKKAP